mmetsp:Transcript_30269/g.48518  ORF Transcript_30269/g.48518 Transcript_30269/m.48518 type:complete len:101 (+) Transcript_30269:29-331(+)
MSRCTMNDLDYMPVASMDDLDDQSLECHYLGYCREFLFPLLFQTGRPRLNSKPTLRETVTGDRREMTANLLHIGNAPDKNLLKSFISCSSCPVDDPEGQH